MNARKSVNLVKGKPPSAKSPHREVGDKEEEGEKTDKPNARRQMPVVIEGDGEDEEEYEGADKPKARRRMPVVAVVGEERKIRIESLSLGNR
ncbi:hypothetical protein J4E80_000199 [Alternaria sp. BMP 0032]|nr:hypothetical protein J4E80_000199 [Alternaria sp. BMP 0032]